MIYLGLDTIDKPEVISTYCREHGITKVFGLTPKKFKFDSDFEWVEWDDIIKYKYFYRLLQEINPTTLIVINECLRTQNRHDLTYNCIRHYLTQTRHQLIFQRFPLIDTFDDFLTLVDFETQSRWKRSGWDPSLKNEINLRVEERFLSWTRIDVEVPESVHNEYQRTRQKLFDEIGLKDPHTIPRQLHLISGKSKLSYVSAAKRYVGRNNRFKLPNVTPYKEEVYPVSDVFEFCHSFIDFSDFLTLSGQTEVSAMVTNLKVDEWYYQRYLAWSQRIKDAYAALR